MQIVPVDHPDVPSLNIPSSLRVVRDHVEDHPSTYLGGCYCYDMVRPELSQASRLDMETPVTNSQTFARGLASTLQAVVFNWQGLMACRWFLAMAEAGFGPGVPYLLSFFYRRHELGLRCGIFLSAAPLATTFAGSSVVGRPSEQ